LIKVIGRQVSKFKLKTSFTLVSHVNAKFAFILNMYTQFFLFKKIKGIIFQTYLILPKDRHIITILRAPCNHKNSKEQYGKVCYKGLITIKVISLTFFEKYFFFLIVSQCILYTKLMYNFNQIKCA